MHLPEKQTKREYENLLPLVNVVFLLLIFFMVAGAFNSADPFSIEPTIAETESTADTKTLTIIMSAEGQLAVGDQLVSMDAALLLIQESIQNESLKKVQLKSDANADALHVVELLERLSETDLEVVHILTTVPLS